MLPFVPLHRGMIIITGDIDLSIGYLAGMAGSYACIVYVATHNLVFAFLFGIFLGALVGAINGLCLLHTSSCRPSS